MSANILNLVHFTWRLDLVKHRIFSVGRPISYCCIFYTLEIQVFATKVSQGADVGKSGEKVLCKMSEYLVTLILSTRDTSGSKLTSIVKVLSIHDTRDEPKHFGFKKSKTGVIQNSWSLGTSDGLKSLRSTWLEQYVSRIVLEIRIISEIC